MPYSDGVPEAIASDGDLHRLQRMAMLGTLASGIGHDVRNMVMPVLLRLDALAAQPFLPDTVHADLDGIRESMTKLQRLASGLRLLGSDPYAQCDEAQFTVIEEWWRTLEPLVRDALEPHTGFTVSIPPSLPVAALPPGTLAQVVMNLAMNARRALQGVPRKEVRISASTSPGCVRLEISDNGLGMDEATRERCFDPYFTTEARGHATGLGLSTARALLKQHGGDLTVRSVPGQGSTFSLSLRAVHAVPSRTKEKSRRTVQLAMRDPRQVAMVRVVLAQHGVKEGTSDATPRQEADIIICDLQGLDEALASRRARRDPDTVQIIAIGPTPGPGVFPGVQWISPHELPALGGLLTR